MTAPLDLEALKHVAEAASADHPYPIDALSAKYEFDHKVTPKVILALIARCGAAEIRAAQAEAKLFAAEEMAEWTSPKEPRR